MHIPFEYLYPKPKKPIVPPPQCQCEICQTPTIHHWFSYDELRSRGYILNHTESTKFIPHTANIHTHGLPHTYTHMDLQHVLLLDSFGHAQILIEDVVNLIRQGKVFKDGDIIKRPHRDSKILFKEAKEDGRDVLRIITADGYGNLTPEALAPWCYQHTLGDIGDPHSMNKIVVTPSAVADINVRIEITP